MQTCTGCGVEKAESDFYRYSATAKRKKLTYSKCKGCHGARMAKWHKANPDVSRSSQWRNKYGIDCTPEQYNEMHDLQAGLCKICGRAESVSGRRLAVDHDHVTGLVRGLLCTKCNTTVGWVEQHPSLIAYLELPKGVTQHG
jgi:hypothetical protein